MIDECVEQKEVFIPKTADLLDRSPIEWLIPGWIPLTGLTILYSDGGAGKGMIWTSIISALSKGNRTILDSPNIERTEKKILLLSSEDAENVISFRLDRVSAYNKNIYVIAQDTDRPEDINLDIGSDDLFNMIDAISPDLVILDPLQSYLPENVEMSSRNQMRHALNPMLQLCGKRKIPVLIIAHTNKKEKVGSGRDKLSDSSDIWDIARSVIFIGASNSGEKYISLEKSSYGTLHVPSILFQIDDKGMIELHGTTDKKMRDFMQESRYDNKTGTQKQETQKSRCEDRILELLTEGQTDADMLNDLLKREGFGEKAIRYGKQSLKNSGLIEMTKYKDGSASYKLVEMP